MPTVALPALNRLAARAKTRREGMTVAGQLLAEYPQAQVIIHAQSWVGGFRDAE